MVVFQIGMAYISEFNNGFKRESDEAVIRQNIYCFSSMYFNLLSIYTLLFLNI